MQVGLIGVGRMGRELARRLKDHARLTAFDRDATSLAAVRDQLGISTAASIRQLAALGTVILAVPEAEVMNCIKELNESKTRVVVINIATNVSQSLLEQSADQQVRCIDVKFVAHAGEMALGIDPVIIVNDQPADLAEGARTIFAPVGKVIVGQADLVRFINRTSTEKALEAAVNIEEALLQGGVSEPEIVRSAIRQVAAGVLKAYADRNLGPFAQDIVRSVQARTKK